MPEVFSTAVFSPDRVYRYELRRQFTGSDFVLWVMLNPSTADEDVDDPTIRRCSGFTRRWGFGGLVVANLFAYRATDPGELVRAGDPVGPENDRVIVRLAEEAETVVCGWGARGILRNRDRYVFHLLRNVSDPCCLGLTKMGHPRHPLYVPYSQQLIALSDLPCG